MLTMQVRVEGLPETRSMLSRVKKVLANMEPGLTAAGKYLLHVFSVEAFESEGGIYGSRWQSLDPRYSLRKSQIYPGRGILERTGRLRRSFRLSTGATFAQIANPTPYGPFHQAGRGVPQRMIVALQQSQRRGVEDRLRSDVLSRLKGAL